MSVYKNDQLEALKEALESLYQQSKPIDIYIQIDGAVPKDIEHYLDQALAQKRIHYLGKRSENKGLSYSLNELLELVLPKYDYIARMDADDICVRERIEKQYAYMQEHKNIDICGGFIEEFNVDTGKRQVIKFPEGNSEILKEMGRRCSVAHVTAFLRSSFFDNDIRYDTNNLTEDYDLWLQGYKDHLKFANVQSVLVYVRTNNAFYSRRKNWKRAYNVMTVKMKFTWHFSLGIKGYFYGIGHFMLYMAPSFIKHIVYQKFR